MAPPITIATAVPRVSARSFFATSTRRDLDVFGRVSTERGTRHVKGLVVASSDARPNPKCEGLSNGRRCVSQWTQFVVSQRGHGNAICRREDRAFAPRAGSRFQGAFRSAARIVPDSIRTIAYASTGRLFMASVAENQSP